MTLAASGKGETHPTPKIPEKMIGTVMSWSAIYYSMTKCTIAVIPIQCTLQPSSLATAQHVFQKRSTYDEYVVHPNPA
jgi:hypothetical protein